jgi:hypothetical protein
MRTILLATALALSACAGSQGKSSNAPATATGNSREVCTQEANTGTNINHTVCRTVQEQQDQRKAAQDLAAPRAKATTNR